MYSKKFLTHNVGLSLLLLWLQTTSRETRRDLNPSGILRIRIFIHDADMGKYDKYECCYMFIVQEMIADIKLVP